MASNTVAVTRDVNQVPVPQYYSVTNNDYEVMQGNNGTIQSNHIPDSTSKFAYSTVYHSAAAESSNVVKASAGTIYKVFLATSITSGTFYFCLFNSATVPSTGTAPTFIYPVSLSPNGLQLTFDMGMFFGTGISWAISAALGNYSTTGVTAAYMVTVLGA